MPTRVDFSRYDTLDDIPYSDEGRMGSVIERAFDAWSEYAEAHGLKHEDFAGQKAFLAQYETPYVAYMTDAVLLRAYQRTSGGADDEKANKLLAEIEQRNLDV